MSSTERLFRNSVFGGFNKEDVINYVESMKNEFFEYRSQVEQTVRDLNKRVADLQDEVKTANKRAAEADKRAADAIVSSEEAAIAAQKAAQEKLALQKAAEEKERTVDPVGEIDLAAERLRRVADEICDNLSSFIERISESSIAVTIAKPAEDFAAEPEKIEPASENTAKGTSKNASFADTESILSFIDGILASNEKKEEEKPQDSPSLLDGLLPNGLFK